MMAAKFCKFAKSYGSYLSYNTLHLLILLQFVASVCTQLPKPAEPTILNNVGSQLRPFARDFSLYPILDLTNSASSIIAVFHFIGDFFKHSTQRSK